VTARDYLYYRVAAIVDARTLSIEAKRLRAISKMPIGESLEAQQRLSSVRFAYDESVHSRQPT
jgi:hypothetical protein